MVGMPLLPYSSASLSRQEFVSVRTVLARQRAATASRHFRAQEMRIPPTVEPFLEVITSGPCYLNDELTCISRLRSISFEQNGSGGILLDDTRTAHAYARREPLAAIDGTVHLPPRVIQPNGATAHLGGGAIAPNVRE